MRNFGRRLVVLLGVGMLLAPRSSGADGSGGGFVPWTATAGGDAFTGSLDVARTGDGGAVVAGGFLGATTVRGAEVGEVGPFVSANDWGDSFLARYDGEGELLWATHIRSTPVGGEGIAKDVAVAPDGTIVVAGWYYESLTLGDGPDEVTLGPTIGYDGFVARFDEDGGLLWAQSIASDLGDQALAVTVRRDGSIVVVGYYGDDLVFNSPGPDAILLAGSGSASGFVACYAPGGRVRWARAVRADTPETYTQVWAVDQFPDGSLVIGGDFNGEVTFGPGQGNRVTLVSEDGDAFVARLDRAGRMEWVRRVGGRDDQTAYVVGAMGDGGAWLGGTFQDLAVATDGTRTRVLDAAGDELPALQQSDMFLTRWDWRGRLLVTQGFGGVGDDLLEGMVALPDESVIVCGRFQGQATFGAAGTLTAGAATDYDGFVGRVTKSGGWTSVLQVSGASNSEIGVAVDAESKRDVHVAGNFGHGAQIGTGAALSASGYSDAFFARLRLER